MHAIVETNGNHLSLRYDPRATIRSSPSNPMAGTRAKHMVLSSYKGHVSLIKPTHVGEGHI